VSGRALNRRVLLVAYPLLPVSDESAGGAEQILLTLERELARRGWETEVAACAGSRVQGRLVVTGDAALPAAGAGVATGDAPEGLDGFAQREREHAERVAAACAERDYAVVLDHSGHFFRHVSGHVSGNPARVRGAVLATLHLPRELYGPEAFAGLAENVYFHCVSEAQRADFMDLPRMLGVVRNGIEVERFASFRERQGEGKSDYLLWLGRVCPEKAPHLAIAAAERAGLPIVLAGQVYPFQWHQQYWEREVKPRIDGRRVRWVALPSFAEKTKLLRQARGLLVTSLVGETTSLVALEAMASGTPVIALRRGALGEVVREGTGYLVDDVEAMAEACGRLGAIRAQDCREWVQREYSAGAMADGYEAMIEGLVFGQRQGQLPRVSQKKANVGHPAKERL
jgi:glycosyltransferase involved in cell wall biosynthesis